MYYKTPEIIYEESKKQAEEDLKNNFLCVKTFGLIRSPELLYQAYAEKGINLRIIAGDIINSSIEADARGYNEIMRPEIEKRFGINIWTHLRQKHLELREQSHARFS